MRPLPSLEETLALAKTLQRIDVSLLKKPPSGRSPHWWKGGEPYLDVFLETDAHGAAWLQVTLRGRCLTWSRDSHELRTGVTNEFEVDDAHPSSKLVRDDAQPSSELTTCVLTLLGGAPADAALAEAREQLRRAADRARA